MNWRSGNHSATIASISHINSGRVLWGVLLPWRFFAAFRLVCFLRWAACLLLDEAAFLWLAEGCLAFLFFPLVAPCRFRYNRMQMGSEKTLVGAQRGLAMTMHKSTQSCPQWKIFFDFEELSDGEGDGGVVRLPSNG